MTLVYVSWDYGGVTLGPWPAVVLSTTVVDGADRHVVLAWPSEPTPREAATEDIANTWEADVAPARVVRIADVRPSNHGPWWYLSGV